MPPATTTAPTTKTTRETVLPLLAIGFTVLMWASAFVAIRHVGKAVSPGGLALGRLLVAAAALGLMMLLRPRRPGAPTWPARAGWPRLVACGVVWLGVYNLALNEAEQRIDAGTASMLVNVGPILIALLAGVFLGEGFPRKLIAGVVVAFAGTVLIGIASSTSIASETSGTGEASGAGTDLWGVLLCLVAAASYATGVITQKPLLAGASGLHVTFLATMIGVAVCLPFAGQLVDDLRTAGAADIGWLVFLGVGPTALAFSTWAYALARSDAGRLGAATYLVPPVVVLMAWLLLDEVPAALALVGGALCLAGVAVTRGRNRSRSRSRRPDERTPPPTGSDTLESGRRAPRPTS